MAGLNDIVALGKRALLAQQAGMQVVGNNISNAQNPDYSRQDVQFSNDLYLRHGNVYFGSGVQIEQVRRIRDQFYDVKYWGENANLGLWENEVKYQQLIENAVNDLGGSGLTDQLDDFWNNWTNVANHPQDISQRKALVSSTNQLINTFHNLDTQFRAVATQAADELKYSITEVNRLLTNISKLNKQVANGATGSGVNNTLLDQRDALVSELSNYLDIDADYEQDGTVTLKSNYMVIVDQVQAFQFRVETANNDGIPQTKVYAYGNKDYEFKSGKLKSLVDTINSVVPEYLSQLDNLAETLVTRVNAVHNQNYDINGNTNIDFFQKDSKTAGAIQLSQDIQNSIWNLAVSKDGQAGDGNGALDIAAVRSAQVMQKGTATISSAFRMMISQIGTQNKDAMNNMDNQNAIVTMIDNQRQAIMGVSVDEEMVNLIKFQTAFGAASKIISSVDEMMQTVLNMV